jgi:hypothetical protein
LTYTASESVPMHDVAYADLILISALVFLLSPHCTVI